MNTESLQMQRFQDQAKTWWVFSSKESVQFRFIPWTEFKQYENQKVGIGHNTIIVMSLFTANINRAVYQIN